MKIENIQVIRDFSDVFSDNFPGLPLEREIEFTINLTLRTEPIFKATYRMAPIELKKLREQL